MATWHHITFFQLIFSNQYKNNNNYYCNYLILSVTIDLIPKIKLFVIIHKAE